MITIEDKVEEFARRVEETMKQREEEALGKKRRELNEKLLQKEALYEQEIMKKREKKIQTVEKNARQRVSEATQSEHRLYLERKTEGLQELRVQIDRALKDYCDTPEYVDACLKKFETALLQRNIRPEETVRVGVAPAQHQAVREGMTRILKERAFRDYTITVEDAALIGGFIMNLPQSHVRVNESFQNLLVQHGDPVGRIYERYLSEEE